MNMYSIVVTLLTFHANILVEGRGIIKQAAHIRHTADIPSPMAWLKEEHHQTCNHISVTCSHSMTDILVEGRGIIKHAAISVTLLTSQRLMLG